MLVADVAVDERVSHFFPNADRPCLKVYRVTRSVRRPRVRASIMDAT